MKVLVSIVCVVLFIVPFFWIGPGELELGGDSSRLYLYDPVSYLQANSLYGLAPDGMGNLRWDQSMLPFLFVLQGLYLISHSSYIVTSLFYSLNLVGAFIFVYLIGIEILKPHTKSNTLFAAHTAAILCGIFYAFAPSVGKPMQTALIIHNQVFLNPLIIYQLLKFLTSGNSKYLWFLLLTTLLFSPNFSLAIPAIFSFYPLTILFLIFYVVLYLKMPIPWKKLLVGIVIFFGIHAFHLLPDIVSVLDPGSPYNTRIFNVSSIQNDGLHYFDAILPYGMVTKNIFYRYITSWTTFVAPFIIIIGFLLTEKIHKDFFLISVFFLITTFLQSANITEIGLAIYRVLFYIPGFSMFRNFYGQWQWVQLFFYTLLFGYSLFLVFAKLKKRVVYFLSVCIVGILVYNSWQFISGQILRQPHRATNNVSTIIRMDPQYEKTINFLKNQPDDGRIFDFPFTEFAYQVVPGTNRGAYIGPSPLSYLGGKRDFSGHIILEPFSDRFLKLIEEKKYEDIKKLFGLLQVKYIYFNADPRAYEVFFPELPYTLLHKVLPDTKSLRDFVKHIAGSKVFQSGTHSVYSLDENYYLPHFFVSETQKAPRIGYKRINPTKYKVSISNAIVPFTLVFSEKYHAHWKAFITESFIKEPVQATYLAGKVQEYYHENIFLNNKTFETLGMNSIPDKQHTLVNGYANAWYITPKDSHGEKTYEIIIELIQQRTVYYGLVISALSTIVFIVWGIKLFVGKKGKIVS